MAPQVLLTRITILVACLTGAIYDPSTACADIKINKLFSDHMVLQQRAEVKIWGTAAPGQELIVKFNDQVMELTTDSDGNWSTTLKTPAAGGPYEIEVAAASGSPRLLLSDVMIGEVWICAGESNMEWPTSKVLNPETEIKLSKNYPLVRLFQVHPNATSRNLGELGKVTPWEVCSAESVKDFSAVAYFFARELNKKMKCPVGLIQVTCPGSPCEAWTARAAMDQSSALGPLLRQWDENDNPTSTSRPSNLFNGMVAPLAGFGFQGVIWYQGESNVGRGYQYATLFPIMINCWRQELAAGAVSKEFPFYFVQPTPHRYENYAVEDLPEVWDAQFKTFSQVKNVGMVTTTDIGDIQDLRPKNKQEVGRRLALWALAKVYPERVDKEDQVEVCSGPVFESLGILENKIRVTFKPESGDLQAPGDEKLAGFSICGEDRKFYPADAWIEGQAVIVTSPEVEKPVAVRFAWKDTAQPNLFNRQGLPAPPFRTDDFELLSRERDF